MVCVTCGNKDIHYRNLCRKCYRGEEYVRHKEKIDKRNREWRRKNPEKFKQGQKVWRENNIEDRKIDHHEWYKNNKERLRINRKKRYYEEQESAIEYSKQYYQEHKQERLDYNKIYYKTDNGLMVKKKACKQYYKSHKDNPEYRHKRTVRRKTIRKYGKLPKGYEYHHYTNPYEIDKFVILKKEEHTKIH